MLSVPVICPFISWMLLRGRTSGLIALVAGAGGAGGGRRVRVPVVLLVVGEENTNVNAAMMKVRT